MNILFFLRQFPVLGGVEKITVTLANALSDRGYKIIIIGDKGKDFGICSNLSNDVRILFLPNKKFISFENIDFVRKTIKENSIKYFINQGSYIEANKFIISLGLEIPVITVLHNDPLAPIKDIDRILSQSGLKSFIKRTFKYCYKKWVLHLVKTDYRKISNISYKVVLLSASYIDSFKKLSNIELSKICVIPNCFAYDDLICDYNKKENIVIYVGRVVEQQKRLSRLFRIWKRIDNERWKLLIIGDGTDLNYYKQFVMNNDINNIEFCGFITNVKEYMKKALIITLVSDFEGFPMTIIEAMHEKCIPLSYGSFSAIYDVLDETNGFIIPPFNEKKYLESLEMLMQNSELRKKLSNSAYKTSLRYDVEIIIDNWIKILK